MHCFVKQKNPFKTQRGVRSVAMKSFPRTKVAGVSLPRMLMGTNWVYGWSHTGAAADRNIVRMNSNREAIQQMLEAYLAYDINALMGPISDKPFTYDAIHAAEDKTGKGIILIDTPILNVDDTPEGNYPSFNLREADLAHHLLVTDGKDTKKASDANDTDWQDDDLEPAKVPTLRYQFGDDKDFPLQQAVAHLLGKKVITHADVQKKLLFTLEQKTSL